MIKKQKYKATVNKNCTVYMANNGGKVHVQIDTFSGKNKVTLTEDTLQEIIELLNSNREAVLNDEYIAS
jgi:hypothetical protein